MLTHWGRRAGFAAGVLVLVATAANGQSILTIAGGGPLGDGFSALRASLNTPMQAVMDADGNLFIADSGNQRVRHVDGKTGVITTYAGGGTSGYTDGEPATAAELTALTSVAIGPDGNLYIAASCSVFRVDHTTRVMRRYVSGYCLGFMKFDHAGNLVAAVTQNHTIVRFDRDTRQATTIAGRAGVFDFSGDGGPATAAALAIPYDVAWDDRENLYIADSSNRKIRKVDPGGTISTFYALCDWPREYCDDALSVFVRGNDLFASFASKLVRVNLQTRESAIIAGKWFGYSGDDGPAIDAVFGSLNSVYAAPNGDLILADAAAHRIRRISAQTGIIDTIVGANEFGDGGIAAAAQLSHPMGVVTDSKGNLFIADNDHVRVRRVDARTGIISTYVRLGDLAGCCSFVFALAMSKDDVLHVASQGVVWRVDPVTQKLKAVAGGGNGPDPSAGGLATNIALGRVEGVALGPDDSLYVGNNPLGGHNLIGTPSTPGVYRVDPLSGIISTVAGNGPAASSGDGGPATAASLKHIRGLAVDAHGNVYIADDGTSSVRKVDAATGLIETFAFVDSGVSGVAVDDIGAIWTFGSAVDRWDPVTRVRTRIAGGRDAGFAGDNGPSLAARLSAHAGTVTNGTHDLFIADETNNRIRAVYGCINPLGAAQLQQPANAESGTAASPKMAWGRVKGAFTYDIYLDTVNPPKKIAASDLTVTSYAPSNLDPLTTYYWKVTAKGDPFCNLFAVASTEVRSFTTAGKCASPPAVAATLTVLDTTIDVSWNAAERASSYDLYLGTTTPPRLYASNVTSTRQIVSGLAAGTLYWWKVRVHASCDDSLTSETSTSSFVTGGTCGPARGPGGLDEAVGGIAVEPCNALLP